MKQKNRYHDQESFSFALATFLGAVLVTRSHSRKPTTFNRGMNANVLQFDRSIAI